LEEIRAIEAVTVMEKPECEIANCTFLVRAYPQVNFDTRAVK